MSWAVLVAYAMQAIGTGTIIGCAVRDILAMLGL